MWGLAVLDTVWGNSWLWAGGLVRVVFGAVGRSKVGGVGLVQIDSCTGVVGSLLKIEVLTVRLERRKPGSGVWAPPGLYV